MKHAVWALFALMAAATASAAEGSMHADPGIYGPIDLSRFPKPQTVNRRPVIASLPAKPRNVKPVYLHVVPGEESHWHARCGTYAACHVPVYFVTEGWFVNVYLP